MGTPTSQIGWDRSINHVASNLCSRNALLDLLDPMGRWSLNAKPGELSLVHQATKHKAEERTFAFLWLSAKDARNNILDQEHER